MLPLVVAQEMGLGGTVLGLFLTALYVVEVLTMTIGGGWSDRGGRRRVVLLGTTSGIGGMGLLALAVHHDSTVLLFVVAVPLGIAGGSMLSLLPAVLVDLAGAPEVGLSATRLSRDLGFTLCTVGAGAAISLAHVPGAIALILSLLVVVTVSMLLVGETRRQQRHDVAEPLLDVGGDRV